MSTAVSPKSSNQTLCNVRTSVLTPVSLDSLRVQYLTLVWFYTAPTCALRNNTGEINPSKNVRNDKEGIRDENEFLCLF